MAIPFTLPASAPYYRAGGRNRMSVRGAARAGGRGLLRRKEFRRSYPSNSSFVTASAVAGAGSGAGSGWT